MSAYRILLGPIADGAALREDGSTIELAEADAAPLLEVGAIEPAQESKAAPARMAKAVKAKD
jgi:hypothetical protein